MYVNRVVGWRLLVWALLLSVLAVVLQFVPLLDVLGYDYAFAVGLVAAFAAVDVGQGVVAAERRAAGHPRAIPLSVRAVVASCSLLLFPLLASVCNAARVRNCSLAAGLAFFLLLPLGTVLFAAPAGVLAGLTLRRGGRALALALPLLSGAWALLRLYRDPPVFMLDPFAGYFPGPIYDEALRPDLRLLAYRGACLVWIAAAVAVATCWQARSAGLRAWLVRASVVAMLVSAAVVLLASEGRLGFHPDRAAIGRALAGEVRSSHFVLRFDDTAGRAPADLRLELEDLEFRYAQLSERLGVQPSGPVTVYEFPSPESKKALVGAGLTLFARPWTREIFVHEYHFPSPRLRHEMAHVFAGTFGDRIFGISLAWRWRGPVPWPRLASGLVEGLAEAADADDPLGRATLHQEARVIVDEGRAPPLADIVGAGFSLAAGARAYTLAGSFCTFLLERHGAAKLRQLYRSAGDFQAAYGVSLATLEVEWRTFLAQQPVDDRERAGARERYRRPAIFGKVCAREQAARVAEAHAVLPSDPARAVAILAGACHDSPDEPTLTLDLAEALAAAGEPQRALAAAASVAASEEVTDPLRARAASVEGAIAFSRGDVAGALDAARREVGLATDEGVRRLALAKAFALAAPEARASLARALFGDGPARAVDAVVTFHLMSEFAQQHPGSALGPYLVGRQLAARDAGLALAPLRRALELTSLAAAKPAEGDLSGPLPLVFHRECLRMTADAAYRAGQWDVAAAAATSWVALPGTEAEHLRARDFLSRVAWGRQNTARAGGGS